MASAEEYAKWIVENQDKQGTPDFETVAKAYQAAKMQQPREESYKDILFRPRSLGVTGGLETATKLLDKAAYDIGGFVTDIAAPHMQPETAAGLGLAANVATQALPTILSGNIVGKSAAPAMRGGAERLMQSAVKPGIKPLLQGKAERGIGTLLDEGINITPGGVQKLQGKIDDLNNLITRSIQTSGQTVDKGAVASRIQDVINRIERTNPTPQDAIADVSKVYNNFLANQLVPKNIPAPQAQELKQGIYRVLREKYGTLGSDTVEAQKALARGFKEELAAKIPELAKLNAKESELINALNLAERRVLISGNKNPAGLGLLVHHPTAMAAFLADRSELFKSVIARMLNAGQYQIPAATARVLTGAGVAYNNTPSQQ